MQAAEKRFFASQIRPLLEKKCWRCHGRGDRVRGGLRLTSRAAMLRGGDSGAALDIDDPTASLLLEAVRYEGLEMPPSGQLSTADIATLTRWVQRGAPWDGEADTSPPASVAAAGTLPPQVNAETRNHWAFRARQPVTVPSLAAADRTVDGNEVDAFLAAARAREGITPVGPAAKRQLIRRIYYDTTGLPPNRSEVERFVADTRPQAYPQLVDRLLGSPHFGEQWARHWLDLVRYAETNSYERDGDKPFVWKYRDYVIRSFNSDKPYDQFIREQLAGDELEPATADALTATGYYRLGIWDDEPVDREQAIYDDLDDILATTGQVFLGLTVNCARCHDHKLDPFPQRDYYRLLAFFNGLTRLGQRGGKSIEQNSVRPLATEAERKQHDRQVQEYRAELERLDRGIKAIEKLVRADLSPVELQDFKHAQHRLPLSRKRVPHVISAEQFADYQRWITRRDTLKASPPEALARVLCVTEIGREPRETFVLVRGNVHAPGERAEPGFPSVLTQRNPELVPPPANAVTCGRRRVLADWIAADDNPLTARVIVNRIWQHYFGRGLVATPSDFGLHGARPTHPELLDWLANVLVRNEWKMKAIHRKILLSSAYRMASTVPAEAAERDPENRWLGYFRRRRLTGEEIRDSLLAANGSLNRTLFGPSIFSVIPAEVLATQSRPGSGWGTSTREQQLRRSIYIKVKRSLITPLLARFDNPDPDASCPVRFTTTQPTQALAMLNSELLHRQSLGLAQWLGQRHSSDINTQLAAAYWQVLQRGPSERELLRDREFLEQLQREFRLSEEAALTQYCLMLFNLNEFIYLD